MCAQNVTALELTGQLKLYICHCATLLLLLTGLVTVKLQHNIDWTVLSDISNLQ